MLRALPIGPMLLIAVVPYKIWAPNSGTYPLWQAHRAALILVLAVACAALALRRLGLDGVKTSVAVAVPVLFVSSYLLSPIVPLVTAGIALVAAAIDRRRRYANANLVLIVMGTVLLTGATFQAARYANAERRIVEVEGNGGFRGANDEIVLSETPSIIHIVLDGYGATEPLAEIYGHDTRRFFDQLGRRGFVVFEDAVTPYSQTLPAIASVMSGAPVDMSDSRGSPRRLRADLGYTIRNGPVISLFEASGYTIARAKSGYAPVDFGGVRDVTSPSIGMTEIEATLLRSVTGLNFFGRVHNDRLKNALVSSTLTDLPKPFFYYQHLIAPHPPFSIAADGSARDNNSSGFFDGSHLIEGSDEWRAKYIAGYREKARFIESALIAQIDKLPDLPMIVIIHGDHGPGAYLDHESAARTCMGERLRTFFAIYSDVPALADRLIPLTDERISIVNIYRAVLSALSDADIPLLAAESRFLRWQDPTAMIRPSRAEISRPCDSRQGAFLD